MTARDPLVSILLPARDAVTTLPAALRSIARQREARWECIAVDDGSRDATLACLQAFADRDARLVVVAAARRGLVAALNTGLAHCRGAFVARMDADDLMHRDRLAAQLEALSADPMTVAVGSHVRLFPRHHLRRGWRAYECWLNAITSAERVRAEAFVECPIAHPTLMIRREALTVLGYRDRGWPEDYDLLLRLLTRGDRVGVVPRRLLAWRDVATRLTRTSSVYDLARIVACKASFLADSLLSASDQYVLWGYGATGRTLRRALLAHGKRPSHVVELHPGRLGNTIHGAPVIRPDALSHIPRRPIVASVAGAEPRQRIRAALAAMGFVETRDFVCAA